MTDLQRFYRSQPLAKPHTKRAKAKKKRLVRMRVRDVRHLLVTRAQQLCERCGVFVGTYGHAHHIKPRSLGGKWLLSNLKYLCVICHEEAHRRSKSRAHTPVGLSLPKGRS